MRWSRSMGRMRWFVRGDVDGFFGLALDNLVQLLLIDTLCRDVLGFPDALVYGRSCPAPRSRCWSATSSTPGRPAARAHHRPRRRLRAALRHQHRLALRPCLPGHAPGEARGRGGRRGRSGARGVAGRPGRLPRLRGDRAPRGLRGRAASARSTPRAALLSTLAGIALGFISIGFLFRTFARPIVGLATLAVVLLVYFGRVRFRGGLPGGLVAVALGTLLRLGHRHRPGRAVPPPAPAFHAPVPVLGDAVRGARRRHLGPYFSVIVPMGLFTPCGSLQNIESAEAAGDAYPTRPRWRSTASARSRPRASAPASRRRSTSATRAGRRWARAPATRCSTACSSPSSA